MYIVVSNKNTNEVKSVFEVKQDECPHIETEIAHVPEGVATDYDFIDGEFVYNAISATKREVRELKDKLAETDYAMSKATEELLSCTGITDIIRVLKKYSDEYGSMIASRKAWRERINELEN